MPTTTTTIRALVLVAAAVGACACGGGGSSTAGIDRGGVRTPALASGTISSFGSVIVRGTRFATDGASIVIDGAPGVETQLGVGQVVAVTGEVAGTAQTASRIELDHDVVGPIETLDLAGTLVVLGQPVRLDATTAFDATIPLRSLEGLDSGDIVGISGFYAADGALLASRIAPVAAGAPWRVHGFVANLDTTARRLQLNALTVDYSTATVEGFPSGEPRNGDFVVVQGVAGSSSGVLRATALRHQRRAPFAASTAPFEAVVEGLITRFGGSADFEIDGQPAAASATTQLANGTLADLRLDARVVGGGTVDANGVLAAATLAFVPTATVLLQAPVAAVDAAAGTVTVLGTTVRVLADTYFEDLTGGERVFTLADLAVGDWLTLSGYEDPADNTRLIAMRLARDNDDDDDVEITGPVRTLADPEFAILAIRILTTSSTEFDDLDRAVFFAGPAGLIVEVEGTLSGNVVVATEVEPED